MTRAAISPKDARKGFDQWVISVKGLLKQIADWSRAGGWSIKRTRRKVEDRLVGKYEVPCLIITTPTGELHARPAAMHMLGLDGRVDIESWPMSHRVSLFHSAGKWEIMTESHVPLRQPWNSQTFVQLTKDLLS